MRERRNGNVRHNGEDTSQESARFKEGDVVALTPAALKLAPADMVPLELHEIGHENRFIVLCTFETEKNGPCITLSPCCLRFRDWKTGKLRCKGHPEMFFEKVGIVRMPKKGDKSSSLVLPFIGELLRFEYEEDDDTPKFNANIAGLKGSATGFWAKLMKKLAEDGQVI